MKRFVDLRGIDTGFKFAWFCTVHDVFEEFDGQQTWDTWEEFEKAYRTYHRGTEWDLDRYRSLCPDWAEGK